MLHSVLTRVIGHREPSSIYPSLQFLLLWNAVTALRRIDPRDDRTHKEHRTYKLDQFLQSLARNHGF
jgi:thymidylate kinase